MARFIEVLTKRAYPYHNETEAHLINTDLILKVYIDRHHDNRVVLLCTDTLEYTTYSYNQTKTYEIYVAEDYETIKRKLIPIGNTETLRTGPGG